jgi:hypothetical protein
MTNVMWEQLPSGVWVMSFNGASSVVTITNKPIINFTKQLTLMAWVKSTVAARQPVVYKSWTAGVVPYGLELLNGLRSTTPATWNTLGLSTSNRWQFICGTFDSSLVANNAKSYSDGVLTGWVTSAVDLGTNTGNMQLGYWAGFYYTGYMAFVRALTVPLTPPAIRSIYSRERRLFGV